MSSIECSGMRDALLTFAKKVLQFLQHDGYVETARAFAEEMHAEKGALSLDADVEIEGINIKDDEDANKRQREFHGSTLSVPVPPQWY